MTTGLALLVFLLLRNAASSASSSASSPAPYPVPSPQAPPVLPPGTPYSNASVPISPVQAAQAQTPPWPQAAPTSGLPPFPGGWEPDEPPPPAVVTRAYQLLDQLWATGSGSRKVEQTGGRWITYRAEIVASGKKGIVAYRVKGSAHPVATTAPAPHPTAVPAVHYNYPPGYGGTSFPAPVTAHPGPAPGVPPFVPAVAHSAPGPAVVPAVWIPGDSPTAPGKRLLKRGMKGDDVKWLQDHLRVVPPTDGGYGTFGPKTETAVRAYQSTRPETGTNGHPDGEVGPKTWASLFATYGAPMA